MAIRAVLCLILLAAASPAQWKRHVETLERGRVDSPPARDLDYFKVDPCSRSDKSDQFTPCEEPPSEEEIQRRAQTRTDLRVVGKIGSFTVYDVEYFFALDYPGPHMRLTLVEAPGHRFHEICIQEKLPSGTLFPTKIFQAGKQPVLSLTYDEGGMYHNLVERLFAISGGVAVLLDLGPVVRAAEGALPQGMGQFQSAFDFKSLVYSIGTERLDAKAGLKVACCEGRIEVPFRIEKGIVVAGKAQYIPEWPPGSGKRN